MRTLQGFAASFAVAGLLSFGVGGGAAAAELKVISAGAVRGVIGGMIDDYARQSGHTFKFTVGSTGRLREIIASGEPADLIIASAPLMAELEATGRMTPGSRVDIGRIGLGVVIREGAVAPDVSTPDALRQALVNATSIAYTDPKLGGTSYVHLMKIAGTFGIADVVAGKGVHATGGNDAVAKVAAGEAELAIVLISEIHAKGAKLVAPLPEPLQLWTVYAAAIPASSAEPDHARALIAALTAPAMRPRWVAAGWEPAQ
ncbi:MAG TPA: substrate-binding domain-containing protein [Xanthobacteraceae bacterium]|nr:substrate-binding domain-containing protein [Xanthobacteraceae bacterium]